MASLETAAVYLAARRVRSDVASLNHLAELKLGVNLQPYGWLDTAVTTTTHWNSCFVEYSTSTSHLWLRNQVSIFGNHARTHVQQPLRECVEGSKPSC